MLTLIAAEHSVRLMHRSLDASIGASIHKFAAVLKLFLFGPRGRVIRIRRTNRRFWAQVAIGCLKNIWLVNFFDYSDSLGLVRTNLTFWK